MHSAACQSRPHVYLGKVPDTFPPPIVSAPHSTWRAEMLKTHAALLSNISPRTPSSWVGGQASHTRQATDYQTWRKSNRGPSKIRSPKAQSCTETGRKGEEIVCRPIVSTSFPQTACSGGRPGKVWPVKCLRGSRIPCNLRSTVKIQ